MPISLFEEVKKEENACKFCSIINKTDKSYIVFEDDLTLAFLDIKPLFPGHTLLVPKLHFKTLPELPIDILNRIFVNLQFIEKAVEKSCNSEGSFIAINNNVSQSIPHLHIHIVPRNKKDGLKGFFWPRNKYKGDEEIKEFRDKIKSEIELFKV